MELLALEEQYFNELVSFDDVLDAYEAAEAERSLDFDYWLSRARFFAIGCLREFMAGEISVESHQVIVEYYVKWMDTAIEHYAGNSTPLRMEKEQTIGDINNTFEGPRLHQRVNVEPEPILQSYRNQPSHGVIQAVRDEEELEQQAEIAAVAMAARNKKRILIGISLVTAILLILGAVLFFLNRQSVAEEEASYEQYEVFLQLSHLVALIEDETTRRNVRDFDLSFLDANATEGPLRVTAPTLSNLGTMNFYFDDNDILTRISIRNANYFNDIPGTSGLNQSILAGYNVDILDSDSTLLNFEISGLTVVITYRNNRFTIDISSGVDETGLSDQQQAVWDQIENRLAAGYQSWAELIEWAIHHQIPFDAEEGGQRPINAVRILIDRYGLVGNYIGAEPGFGTLDDEDAVLLILNFNNLTYNSAIAELSGLNGNSERTLTTWLDAGGLAQLEREFADVQFYNIDYATGYRIYYFPAEGEAEIEFIRWELIHFDHFKPTGQGEVVIQRVYRITEIEQPDVDYSCGPTGCYNDGPADTLPPGWNTVPGSTNAAYSVTYANNQNCLNGAPGWSWVHTGNINPSLPIWTCQIIEQQLPDDDETGSDY